MIILLKVRKSVKRSLRILKVVRWKRHKARLAYVAWMNNDEYVSVGSRVYQN